jgi:poly(3-hydroxybutyrate) depolymerase
MHERTNLTTMKKRLYAYRKTLNECNSEKIKQNNYENHEIQDRTCRAERKIEHRSVKKTKHAHCRPKYTWSLDYGVASKTTMNT